MWQRVPLELVMRYRSAVTNDNARVDIRASGFWRCLHHRTFFDIRVFNSFAASNRSASLAAIFHRHEAEKHRAYEEWVCEVEHGSFTPLIFSSSGGMGKAATTCKHLAHLLSQNWSSPYSVVMGWLWCSLGFSLLHYVHLWLMITLKASCYAHSCRSCRCWRALNCQLSQCCPGPFQGPPRCWGPWAICFSCWCHPAVQLAWKKKLSLPWSHKAALQQIVT